MLLEFSVENFSSFKERVTLSMLPAAIKEKRKIAPVVLSGYKDLAALPSAVLYGKNNSGKSNLIKALLGLQWIVTKSGSFNSDVELAPYEPFLLDITNKETATRFEIDFIVRNEKRYVFSVAFLSSEIIEEQLIRYNNSPTGKTTQSTLYSRQKQNVKFGSGLSGKKDFNFNANQLILSRGDIEGNQELKSVYSFFSKNHLRILQLAESAYIDFLTQNFKEYATQPENSQSKALIDKILTQFDANILHLKIGDKDLSSIKFPEKISDDLKQRILQQLKTEIRTVHRLYDGENEIGIEEMPLSKQSTGTRKLLAVLPEILPTLQSGGVLFMDELNTSLHTEVTAFLIRLFNNPTTNPYNAQLVSTTHDITLLDRSLYDRDQVYIVDKDKKGISSLSSFSDFKISNLRSANLAQYYEKGEVGGLPDLYEPFLHFIISECLQNGQKEQEQAGSR